jgi:PAS domain-containing protein
MTVLATDSSTMLNDIEARFRKALKSFSLTIKDYGFNIQPYSELTWKRFGVLSSSQQLTAFEKFETYQRICASAKADFEREDDRSITWAVLSAFGFKVCSDFFDKLEKDDILEVYNPEGIQIHRNWNFFEISGYTLGDVFVYPWNELYIRTPDDAEQVRKYCASVLSGEVRSTVAYVGPEHPLQEAFSDAKYKMTIHFKYFSPVFTDGAVSGFICTSRVEHVSEKLTSQSQSTPPLPGLRLISSNP